MINVNDNNYFDVVRFLVQDNRMKQRGCNLQNIPSKGNGEKVRRCFVPPKGWVFVGADLSQIEPRIQSHIMYTRYGDNSLRSIFVEGVDLYTTMAMRTFNLDEKYCVDKAYDPTNSFQPRKLMKQGVLAVSYQQTPKAFAKTMNVSEQVAEDFFKNFEESFPSFSTMVKDTIDFMRKNGFTETLYGRKRRFPKYQYYQRQIRQNEPKLRELYQKRKKLLSIERPTPLQQEQFKKIQEQIRELRKPQALAAKNEREAFNAVIQGTGSDILKQNGARMYKVCLEKGWRMNASIHDELIISMPEKDVTPENIQLVNDIMTKTVKLSVPLKSDTVIMTEWMEEVSPEEWFSRG
ncbi:DNA polymerase [Thermoactinomyces vulgaris]|uniref:DNA polymerase n=1 Tax=Thermoactinomyces vulgaris TaxID=2026 RepID=UPI0036320A83